MARLAGPPAAPSLGPMAGDRGEAADERLPLLFACCNPALALEARIALTLRAVVGLTTAEIARAFLVPEATLAQRIVRAKRKITAARIPSPSPRPRSWPLASTTS